jgi:predicted negative regulator of RcsB-dependent stress response
VAINAAEEETIEALKRWWNENGKQLLGIVIVALSGFTGWLLWQNNQSAAIESSSNLYEEILTLAFSVEEGGTLSEEDSLQVIAYADELMRDHSQTAYARYAALYAAQQHVRHGDMDAAESALRWVVENPLSGLFTEPDEGLQLTATLRLGRILLAKGAAEQALALINGVDPQGFEAGYSELRGDIYLSLDRFIDARDAYIAAQQAGSTSEALRMKLQSLPTDS